MGHLYWWLNIDKPNLGNRGNDIYINIAKLELRGSVGGADQCVGGTASADSYIATEFQVGPTPTAAKQVRGRTYLSAPLLGALIQASKPERGNTRPPVSNLFKSDMAAYRKLLAK